ncbi:hypothetical protein ACE38W_00830 [Chitinophaga sp. Hz27]|uniref:hypothetical protein n=1 Tax=Chitinophaga sp. Hz27 TaxID=3347169 RepID=UPI0035D94761
MKFKSLLFHYSFVIIIFCPFLTVAQNPLSPKDSLYKHFDAIKNSYNCSDDSYKVVSEDAIRTIIRRDFSYLVLNRDQGAATTGTGFTLDLGSDNTVATYNISFMNGAERKLRKSAAPMPPAKWILSGSIGAGYSNSIGSLFSNTKANPQASISTKLSIILRAGPKNLPTYCKSVIPISQQYIEQLKTTGYIQMIKYGNLKTDLASKQADRLRFEQAIKPLPDSSPVLPILLDSLNKTNEEITSILQQIADAPPSALAIITSLNDSLISYEVKNIKWNKQTIYWLDFSFGYNIGSYNLFDDVTSFKNSDTTSKKNNFGVAWLGIMNWKKQLFYWKLGYRNTSASNIDNASSYTLDESAVYNNGSSVKKIGESINAYKLSETGSYATYRQHIMEGDGMYMFCRNLLGIHIFGDLGFSYKTDLYTTTGVLNGGIGFVFTVYDQSKEKAKVNIEPFFKLKDVNGQTPLSNTYDTWERFTFGIKAGLPFNRLIL